MANLYYNNYNNAGVDYAWDTLGNWWNDAAFTSPAAALPANGDTVYLLGAMFSGPSTSVTLAHIYVDNVPVNFTGAVGNATFNGYGGNYGTLTGDATFNDFSQNDGTVTGDATFTASSFVNIRFGSAGSYNFTSLTPVTFTYIGLDWTYDPSSWIFTTANPTWTFSGSYNFGTVTGDATFNDNSSNIGGTVLGDATFNDNSSNNGTVAGNATFNRDSYNSGTVTGDATFNESGDNSGTVTGDATFNGGAFNSGTVTGNATFNGYGYYPSANFGTVSGNATFNANSYNGSVGIVIGNAAFFDSSYNTGTVIGDLYINGTYYIGGQATATLFFTNTSGDGLWATLLNWENHLGANPKEVPWTGFLTGLVNLQLASGAPAPLLNGLLVGGKRKIVSTCDERIAQAIIQNGLNIVSPLIYI